MNNNKDSNSGDKSSEKVATFRTGWDGVIAIGERNEDTSIYEHKSDRKSQAPRVKGSNGIGKEQRKALFKISSYLWYVAKKRLGWIVITYSFLDNEEYENIHRNWNKFGEKIEHILDKVYEDLGSDLPLWIAKWELSKERTKVTGKPHFDVNICLVCLDENGEPLFDKEEVENKLYKALSKVAKCPIKPPVNAYAEIVKYLKGGFRRFSGYFCKVTDEALLAQIKLEGTNIYFPKQWVLCARELRRIATDQEGLDVKLRHWQLTDLTEDEFKDEIEKVERNEGGAYIRMPFEEYDPFDAIDRMEERLSQETDNVERL